MKLRILPAAWNDLAAAFVFYESQMPGVGDKFRDSLMHDIDSLRTTAGIHRRIFGFYRLLACRFPYAIYYSCEEGTVLVRAVVDCRRNPSWIEKRVK
jgi:plasmid stabilization system protein ParE